MNKFSLIHRLKKRIRFIKQYRLFIIISIIGLLIVSLPKIPSYEEEKSRMVQKTISPDHITTIKEYIERCNRLQIVYNQEKFGILQSNDIIISIQTHNRINYLQQLIKSLAEVVEIAEILLIFSHDYYDEEINKLIKTIDFCKFAQIFYPYSIQIYPNEFPGFHPEDCPRNLHPRLAGYKQCNNALYPDIYSHYREPEFTQIKHHWWWKMNNIFNGIITKEHNGLVLFLEEDHFVTPDLIHVIKLMQTIPCEKCNIFSLGNYNSTNYQKNTHKVMIMPWISGKHNMGMVFNRSTWQEIVNCAHVFCQHDDYNWDWSLQQISEKCMKNRLFTIAVRASRVFHIGETGVHHKERNDDVTLQVEWKIQRYKASLFPRKLVLAPHKPIRRINLMRNGGWGDIRDHNLCFNMTIL